MLILVFSTFLLLRPILFYLMCSHREASFGHRWTSDDASAYAHRPQLKAARSQSQPATKQKKKTQMPRTASAPALFALSFRGAASVLVLCRRPYFEAEEVGFAHQEPQQSGWVPYYEAEEVGHSSRALREQASEEPRQSGWLPYYEAAEVGNTPRDHRENAIEESQESGWVLPSLPFAAFAGFASAAAWSSSPADATTEEEDLPSSEAHLRA